MRNLTTLLMLTIILMFGLAISIPLFAEEENIEFVPGKDSGFYYTIQKGDTLWDLSQKFYNSQWDWPGLWEINDDIKNPHWIYPGKKIRIFLKGRAKLKPIVVPVKKVKKQVAVEPVKPSFSFSQIDGVGFIRKEKQKALGRILKEEDNHLLMNEKDIIYIKPSGTGTLIPGKIYHVFNVTPVDEKIADSKFTGFKHMLKAKIKILDHKVSYVTAVITDGNRPVLEGDLIMDLYDRQEILTVDDKPEAIDARIIGSEDNNLMINDFIIGFINVGDKTVKPGQIYTVYRTNELKENEQWSFKKKKKESIELENLPSGKLIVLDTEDIASTVMILSSGYAIRPNDVVN